MKRLSMLFVVILFLIPFATVSAQEAIEANTIVSGEITEDAYEAEYTFSGTADSIVIIEMLARDEDGFMNDLTASIAILDSSGELVIDTSDNFVFGDAVLVTQLPADDDYTIVASREDGAEGETLGLYTLEVIVPEVIALGEELSGSASSETGTEYYIVEAEGAFALQYSKSAGDYGPEIRISTVASNNSDFDDVGSVAGEFDNISLGNIDAGTYIVQVREGFFTFYFDEVTADYTLAVNSVE